MLDLAGKVNRQQNLINEIIPYNALNKHPLQRFHTLIGRVTRKEPLLLQCGGDVCSGIAFGLNHFAKRRSNVVEGASVYFATDVEY